MNDSLHLLASSPVLAMDDEKQRRGSRVAAAGPGGWISGGCVEKESSESAIKFDEPTGSPSTMIGGGGGGGGGGGVIRGFIKTHSTMACFLDNLSSTAVSSGSSGTASCSSELRSAGVSDVRVPKLKPGVLSVVVVII